MLGEAGFDARVGGNIGALSSASSGARPGAPPSWSRCRASSSRARCASVPTSRSGSTSPPTTRPAPLAPGLRGGQGPGLRQPRAGDWAVVNADDPVVLEEARRARSASSSCASPGSRSLRGTAPSSRGASRGFASTGAWTRSSGGTRWSCPGRTSRGPAGRGRRRRGSSGPPRTRSRVPCAPSRGVEHVLEHVAVIGGIDYYDDSKATNVEAARRSLEAFAARARRPWRKVQGRRLRRPRPRPAGPRPVRDGDRRGARAGPRGARGRRPGGSLRLAREAVARAHAAARPGTCAARPGLLVLRHVRDYATAAAPSRPR